MELKELSQLRLCHSIYKPFSLTSCGREFAVIGPENFCSILRPFYEAEFSPDYSLKVEYVNASKQRPSASWNDKFDVKLVYYESTALERQNITLDPLYASDFAETPPEPQITAICNAPQEVFETAIIAVLSSYGVCELRTKLHLKRSWDDMVMRINELWPTIFNYDLPRKSGNFQKASNYVNDLHITSCCWSAVPKRKNCCGFYCCTASGWIISLTIELRSAKFNHKVNSGLYKINSLKSFAVKVKNKTNLFLIASDISGIIKLYKEEGSELKEIKTLWRKQDNMPCQQFEVQVCTKSNNALIVTTKAAHFIAFLLNAEGDLLDKCSQYMGGAQITGISPYKPFQYFVVTLCGNLELVTVTFYDQKLMFSASKVSHNIDSKYHILGMCQTLNKVAWIFALYPTKYVDYREKNLCIISVCVCKNGDPLEILKNCNALNIEDYADCAEVIRTSIVNNNQIEYYEQYNPEPVQINDCFLNRLRIRLIIAQSLLLYNRRKRKQKGECSEFEIQSITSTIKAILIYKRLNHLAELESLSEFQKLSGMCLRRALTQYLKEDCNQQFKTIRDILIPVIESLLERTEKLFEGKMEKCLYCGEVTNSETAMCTAQHKMKRCCISYVQIPLLSGNRYCKYCKEVSLEDENLLREILVPNEKVQCALYSCPLVDVSKIVE